jgi:hypothetical protein
MRSIVVIFALLAALVNGAKLKCLFLHGSGQEHAGATEIVGKGSEIEKKYWERVVVYLDSYCEFFFIRTNTVNRAWNDKSLREDYCGAVKSTNADVVFTHSFGNMILGAGIHLGDAGCEKIGKGEADVHWYGSQGPLKGSPGADKLAAECAAGTLLAGFMSSGCDKATKTLRPSYDSLRTTFDTAATTPTVQSGVACSAAGCKTLSEVAADKMSGEMCGQTPHGPLSLEMVGLITASLTVGHGWGVDKDLDYPNTGNDGLVGLTSCRALPPASYGVVPTAPFYVMEGNHKMGTCSYKDKKEASKQPCTWYTHMLAASATAKGVAVIVAENEIPDDDKRIEEDTRVAEAEAEEFRKGEAETQVAALDPSIKTEEPVKEGLGFLQEQQSPHQARKASVLFKRMHSN